MISVIAKIPLQDGKAEEFTEAFKEIAVGVATEKDNFLYSLNFSSKEPNMAVIMERYKDQDALNNHSQTDHFKTFGGKIAGMVGGAPEITVMEEVVVA